MKKIPAFLVLFYFPLALFSQNVGIGTVEPINKLQLHGSFLITSPTSTTNTNPSAPQTKTMLNASTISFPGTDSTCRIYDPGGPAGNYLANMVSNVNIFPGSNVGTELTIESMDLGTGDSLIIKESLASTENLFAVGNGYNSTGKFVFNADGLYLIFKSNADASTGTGFSLLFKRLYSNSGSLPEVSGAAGHVFLFDVKTGSLRSGLLNNAARGNLSTAFGFNPIASGDISTAFGRDTKATGFYSTALGYNTTASGTASTSMGSGTTASGSWSIATGSSTEASGSFSTAMGHSTTASGITSVAIGRESTASGNYSTALGNYVNTNNYEGAFLIGDNSTTTVMNGTTANNFRARFDGGYRFYTSADYSTSCALSPGSNAWSTTSDINSKENFAEVNGEDFLKKIAVMPLVSWNYKKQNPAVFRHYGPMAQDFYAAFGKDKYGSIGNDTTINSADLAGVSLIAIQALEKRTQKINLLEKENADLKNMLLQLRKEVDALKEIKKY